MTPPLRFLGLVIGGWIAARTLVLLWPHEAASIASHTATRLAAAEPAKARRDFALEVVINEDAPDFRSFDTPLPERHRPRPELLLGSAVHAGHGGRARLPIAQLPADSRQDASRTTWPLAGVAYADAIKKSWGSFRLQPSARQAASPMGDRMLGSSPVPLPSLSRWSGSAWMLARASGEGSLAAGTGLLGASQAGARLLYRVSDAEDPPLSLTARLSSPLQRRGAEAAVGVEWQPVSGVPLRLLAERRERLAGEGRSAFALLAHGGVSDVSVSDRGVAAGFRLDAYAQAGVVGARRRDLFADGGATLTRPLGGSDARVVAGVGAWGAAQPDAARLDVGPRVSALVGAGARVSVDWRFRVAGDAAPGSGPSVTLAKDF